MANRPLFSLNVTKKSNKEKFKGIVAVWPSKFEGAVDIQVKDKSALRAWLSDPDDYYASAYVNAPKSAATERAKAIIREEFGPGSDDDFV